MKRCDSGWWKRRGRSRAGEYRRLQLKLEEQGMHVNHKKVYRVCTGRRGC